MSLAKRLLELPEKSALRKLGVEFLTGQSAPPKKVKKVATKKKASAKKP